MKSKVSVVGLAVLFLAVGVDVARAHCEIPCGIFDDDLRIQMINENISTIHKTMDSIQLLNKEKDSAQTFNQMVRWVDLKEDQAKQIQEIVSQYFLAQRIVPAMGEKAYVDLLKKSHELIVLAMKTKQTVDPGIIEDLRTTLKDFDKAYKKALAAKK